MLKPDDALIVLVYLCQRRDVLLIPLKAKKFLTTFFYLIFEVF